MKLLGKVQKAKDKPTHVNLKRLLDIRLLAGCYDWSDDGALLFSVCVSIHYRRDIVGEVIPLDAIWLHKLVWNRADLNRIEERVKLNDEEREEECVRLLLRLAPEALS